MSCTLSTILFVSNVAERSPNGAKIIYDVYFHPDDEVYTLAKLTAWQASTPTEKSVKAGDCILCVGRAYYVSEKSQMAVRCLANLCEIFLDILYIYCKSHR